MADAVNTIIDAVKEMVQDVGEKVGAAVKDALHVPDNFAPMVQTLKELVTSGQKVNAPHFSRTRVLDCNPGANTFLTRFPIHLKI
jgi:phage-related protein